MSHNEKRAWSRAPLSALGILISGQSPPSALVNQEGIGAPYVSGPEQWTGNEVIIDKWTIASAKIAPENSIFIVMKGAGVGNVFPGTTAAIGRDIAAFVPYHPLDRNFILLALREVCRGLIGDARGHIPGLSRAMLLAVWLDIPPLEEQRRVVTKIYDAEDLLRRANDELKIAKDDARDVQNSLFFDAFTGRATEEWRRDQGVEPSSQTPDELEAKPRSPANVQRGKYGIALGAPNGAIPPGWMWTRLAEIAVLRTGHTPSRREPDYWDGDIPWISIPDARANYGNVINDTQQHITLTGLNNSSAEVLPIGTVCLSRTASIGYVIVTGKPMATSQDFLNWTCNARLERDWLLWLLIAERDSLQDFGRGSTHKTIYMEDAERIHVLLPPIEEQRQIVSFVAAGSRRVEEIVSRIDVSKAAARRAREETIDAALQGQLATGDANDEDASILLTRLVEDVEVTRAEGADVPTGDQDISSVSVERLVQIVSESSEGLSPEKLFASAGYRTNAVDLFFSHMNVAVSTGTVRYDAVGDRVVTNET